MIIRNAEIFTGDGTFQRGDLFLQDGRIQRIMIAEKKDETDGDLKPSPGADLQTEPAARPSDDTVIDAEGCYAIPGLIDIHFHGCMGKDFCDGTMEAVRTLAEYEVQNGITAICPATLTLPVEHLCHVLRTGAEFARLQRETGKDGLEESGMAGSGSGAESGMAGNASGAGNVHDAWSGSENRTAAAPAVTSHDISAQADLVGVNMEGPFISHVKKGAQNENYILPCDPGVCEEFLQAGDGLLKIIGLAPEENPQYLPYIQVMKDKVRISLAHTNADYETAMSAFRAGASHAVHLFNAMPEFTHREPGVVGAVADNPHVTAELICDGNHVHPSVVRAAFEMIGPDRIVLISDSLRATGLGDGIIDLGGQEVRVEGTRATLVEGGNLAGSVTNLMDCMRIAVKEMGIPLEQAVRCASINPARVIGEDRERGSLEEGKRADIVLLDKETLRLKKVIKDGREICLPDQEE